MPATSAGVSERIHGGSSALLALAELVLGAGKLTPETRSVLTASVGAGGPQVQQRGQPWRGPAGGHPKRGLGQADGLTWPPPALRLEAHVRQHPRLQRPVVVHPRQQQRFLVVVPRHGETVGVIGRPAHPCAELTGHLGQRAAGGGAVGARVEPVVNGVQQGSRTVAHQVTTLAGISALKLTKNGFDQLSVLAAHLRPAGQPPCRHRDPERSEECGRELPPGRSAHIPPKLIHPWRGFRRFAIGMPAGGRCRHERDQRIIGTEHLVKPLSHGPRRPFPPAGQFRQVTRVARHAARRLAQGHAPHSQQAPQLITEV